MTSSYNSITGTDSANTLIGSTGSDSFSALKGDDNVLGAQAGDIVDLGAGNDSVNFSADADGRRCLRPGWQRLLGSPFQHLHHVVVVLVTTPSLDQQGCQAPS